MPKEFKKIFEIFIPNSYILNDNVKNDYRSNMGKMQWLDKQTRMAIDNAELDYPENCKLVAWAEKKKNMNINPSHFGLIVNHIKINPRVNHFDLFNYERSMKPCIDVFTSFKYWDDDNCNVCNPVIMVGGCAKNGIYDPFKIMDENLKEKSSIEEYFKSKIPQYWFNRTKFKKISDYDLFQLYTIKL